VLDAEEDEVSVVLVLIVVAVMLLAYSNGANDNFKGVATLFGSGTCSYRQALLWATITRWWIAAGALLRRRPGRFVQGKGWSRRGDAAAGVCAGGQRRRRVHRAAGDVDGLPVSTTHALTAACLEPD